MITSIVIVTLLVAFGAGGVARADCGPNITYYAPYPFWFPKYIGPPYTDYQVVQYVTPPEMTAVIVKQRILAINATNPALLPAPKGPPLPSMPEILPPPQK
jgi:hypothetical protein